MLEAVSEAVLEREKTLRFFYIACELPMDVQMLLCHRVYGIISDIMSSPDANDGCKWIGRDLAVVDWVALPEDWD